MNMEGNAKRKLAALLVLVPFVVAGGMAYRYLYRPYAQKKEQARSEAERLSALAAQNRIQRQTGSDGGSSFTVTVRADSFSGYCILRSEEMRKQLKSLGIGLAIEDDKADYVGRLQALQDGKADLAVFTVDSFLTAGAKLGQFPASIIAVIDETRGADAIVAYKTALPSIGDLNKPEAGFVLTANSPSEFLARVVLSDFSLPKLSEKWFSPADGAADVYAAFKKAPKSQPKAYVLWEPFVSKALEDPQAHVLLDSSKLKGYIVDVLVARRQFLVDHSDLAKSVVESYLRAAYSYSQSGMSRLVVDDAKAAGENLTSQDAQRLIQGVLWKNTLENYAHFRLLGQQDSGGLEDMEEIITKVSRVLVNTGALAADAVKAPPNTLFYDKIMKELQASGFHPSRKLGIVDGGSTMPDEIRAAAELPELSDADWAAIVPVGQMRISPITFLRGTDELSLQSKRDLDELGVRLKSMPLYYLYVVGHARAEGDAQANRTLAESRAQSVADYLVRDLSISKNRIRTLAAKPSSQSSDEQSVTFQLGQRPY
jgi:outer membrane protein OmpA-like peptidoglycan-associated protein